MAVRAALGATRSRLFRQLLTESVMLALAGGLLGIAAAYLGLDALTAWAARFTPRAREIGIDGRVLAFSLSVSLATGIFLGTLPALPLRADLHGALKDPPPPPQAAGLRLRGLLIVVQVAMSFTLLIGAGLMLRSFLKLQSTSAGFETQNVLTARFFLHWTKYDALPKTQEFTRGLLSRLDGQPGIVSVAATSNLPLNEGPQFNGAIRIEGKAESPDEPGIQADYHLASPDYFRTLGVPMLVGRAFEPTDNDKAPWVAVVSQSLARRAWGTERPLGKRLRVEGFDKIATVVGVAGDVKERGLRSEKTDVVYLPLSTVSWNEQRVLVRGTATPAALEKQIRAAIRELDREVPLNDVRTLEELRSESVAAPRLTAFLLSLFAALALAITAAGIAGVIAYSVSQRTRELGIRLALGAAPGEVLQMVLRQGMTLVIVGLTLGAVGAVLLSRLLSALLFGVVAGDPLTFVAVSAVLFAVGLLSCLLPARRVTALDPAMALRST
jgi:predicted permease